jgi:hypothetical protein
MADMLQSAPPDRRVARNSDASGGSREGNTRRFVARMIETLFRRPVLSLLPLIVFASLGAWAAVSADRPYVSSGVISVTDRTMLSSLSELPGGSGFTWETPATATSRTINELLGTDEFAVLLVNEAGLSGMLDNGLIDLDTVRESVGAFPSGSNLVTIQASNPTADVSYRLAQATLDTFIGWTLDIDLSQSVVAEQYFEGLLERYQDEIEAARRAFAEYVEQSPPLEDGTRPPEELLEIERLDAEVQFALARRSDALQNIESARLAIEQTEQDISQRLRVVDEPAMPFAPEPSRRQMVLLAGLFLAAGFVLSFAVVVTGAILDRSLRSVDDVVLRVREDVITVVPEGR